MVAGAGSEFPCCMVLLAENGSCHPEIDRNAEDDVEGESDTQ